MPRTVLLFLFAAASLLAAGCGPGGPTTYPVSGNVTWNGEPLAEGDILFEPTDGGVPDGGKIIAGQYTFRAKEGAKQVKIIATRDVGAADPVMGAPRRENYIPAKYNEQTELTAEVTPSGANKFDFPLSDSARPGQ